MNNYDLFGFKSDLGFRDLRILTEFGFNFLSTMITLHTTDRKHTFLKGILVYLAISQLDTR